MPKYRKLPPPEVLKVHGVFSLKPGLYKTGKITEEPTVTDTVVEVTEEEAVWFRDGKIHREDGPAVEWSDGSRMWWWNGRLHLEDGPAVEMASGSRKWYRNGYVHREDGPAYENSNGTREWYLHGEKLKISTLEELQAELQKRKGG